MSKDLCQFFLFYVLLSTTVKCEYDANIEKISGCKDFENKKIKTQLTQETVTDDEGSHVAFTGCIILDNFKIEQGCQVELKIVKEDENGKEVVMAVKTEICKALDDDNSPIKIVLNKFNMTTCPLKAGDFCLGKKELTVKLRAFQEFMCKEYEGAYTVNLYIFCDPTEVVACYECSLQVFDNEDE